MNIGTLNGDSSECAHDTKKVVAEGKVENTNPKEEEFKYDLNHTAEEKFPRT